MVMVVMMGLVPMVVARVMAMMTGWVPEVYSKVVVTMPSASSVGLVPVAACGGCARMLMNLIMMVWVTMTRHKETTMKTNEVRQHRMRMKNDGGSEKCAVRNGNLSGETTGAVAMDVTPTRGDIKTAIVYTSP